MVLCPALAPFIADRLRGVLRCCSADKASCVVAPGDQEFFRVTSGRRRRKGPRSCGSSAGAWPCQVGARKAARMLSPERPNDSTHGLGGFRERPPSAIVHAVVTMA